MSRSYLPNLPYLRNLRLAVAGLYQRLALDIKRSAWFAEEIVIGLKSQVWEPRRRDFEPAFEE